MITDTPASATNCSWLVPSRSILKILFPWEKIKKGAGPGWEERNQTVCFQYFIWFRLNISPWQPIQVGLIFNSWFCIFSKKDYMKNMFLWMFSINFTNHLLHKWIVRNVHCQGNVQEKRTIWRENHVLLSPVKCHFIWKKKPPPKLCFG